MQQITLYTKRSTLILQGLLALSFIILSLVVKFDLLTLSSPLIKSTMIYLSLPFFSFCLLATLYYLIVPKPMVTIDKTGIANNAIGAIKFVAWDEIDAIFNYEMARQKWIGITVKNYEEVYNRQTWLKKCLVSLNSAFAQPFAKATPVINLPESLLPMPTTEFIELIESYYKNHLKT